MSLLLWLMQGFFSPFFSLLLLVCHPEASIIPHSLICADSVQNDLSDLNGSSSRKETASEWVKVKHGRGWV